MEWTQREFSNTLIVQNEVKGEGGGKADESKKGTRAMVAYG